MSSFRAACATPEEGVVKFSERRKSPTLRSTYLKERRDSIAMLPTEQPQYMVAVGGHRSSAAGLGLPLCPTRLEPWLAPRGKG